MPRASPRETSPGRPRLPAAYGVKPATEGRLMRWDAVEARLAAARNYWVATASADGIPHAAPVWGVWYLGAFFFGTEPRSRKGANLAATGAVVVHLESGDDVVIVEGVARRLSAAEITDELDGTYFQKYGVRLKGNPVYRVQPRKAFAWAEADFPESATRWRFPGR